MKQFWEERYRSENYVYGEEPNEFFRQCLEKYQPGSLLLPGEGEGRNAVYAAKLGWDVTAIDFSFRAKEKALLLAARHGTDIQYKTHGLIDFKPEGLFDAIGLVFIHFQPADRTSFHRQMMEALKPGGRIIAELFHKKQINNSSGGPPDTNLLVSEQEIASDFNGLEFEMLEHTGIVLNEGPFHQGKADVIRFVGRKT
jgi:SAM-dependent methyltransferase